MVTVMRPSRARVRKCNDTTPRARCPNSVAPGGRATPGTGLNGAPPGPPHFRQAASLPSRTCATMLTRAVFSEGDAARPVTASQPPGRARKTSKHYRSRWQGRSCHRLLQTRFQRRTKTSTRASKSASVTNAAISFVIRPPIGLCLPQMDDWATLSKTKERTHSGRDLSPQEWRGPAQAHKPAPALAQGYEWFRPMAGPGQGYRAGADGGNTPA